MQGEACDYIKTLEEEHQPLLDGYEAMLKDATKTAGRTYQRQWWPQVFWKGFGVGGLGMLVALTKEVQWQATFSLGLIGGGFGGFWGNYTAAKLASDQVDFAINAIVRMETVWISNKLPKLNRKIDCIDQTLNTNLSSRSETVKLEAQKTQLIALRDYFNNVISEDG